MEVRQIFLVLVDISGYTRFIKKHRVSLLHAERIITELLETVIETAKPPLVLHELEGDAVNFYALSDGSPEMAREIGTQVQGFLEAFRARERELVSECGLCNCEACETVGKLRMKAILHHGEAAFSRVRHFEKVGGEDVILAHRLLKNSIEQDEYILMSEAFADIAGEIDGMDAEPRREECEGIGEVAVKVYYTDPGEITPLPRPRLDKIQMMGKFMWYMLKKRLRPSAEFRHLHGQWEA